MDLELCDNLAQLFKRLSSDPSCRAVVLSGNGKVFSAGVDLKRLLAEGDDYLERFLPALMSMFESAFRFPKPMVAAINGHAIAGGCILACTADYRLAVSRVKIGIPELRVGVPLPAAAIEIMRYAASPAAFQRMVKIGATFHGDECVALGLADELVDRQKIQEQAISKARELLSIHESVFAISKQQLRCHAIRRIEQSSAKYDADVVALWRSDNIKSIVRAYVEERL